MTDEARAEIRKHIQVAMHFGTSDSRVWLNKVLALIDAKDTPSVPLAMLLEIDSPDTHQRTESQLINLAARYGYVVGRDIDP